MIKIKKEASHRPKVLFRSGSRKGMDKLDEGTKDLIEFYINNKEEIELSNVKFDFKNDLYAHKEIKSTLKRIQYNKCCFCEAKVTHIAHGDIEHFRPKAAYIQKAGDELIYPGYFWLAYDWDNLFFSCQLCNQRHKKNLFPLIDESSRKIKYTEDVNDEDIAFLDPSKDNPSDHITFIDEVPRALPGSLRGENTIKSLGLDRSELNEDRKTNLNSFLVLLDIIHLFPEIEEMKASHDAAKALIKSQIFDLMSPESEYSLMYTCLYQQRIKSIL